MKFIASYVRTLCSWICSMSQILTLVENGEKSQAELAASGFQAAAGGAGRDLFYVKSSCMFLLNYCQWFLRSNLFCGSMWWNVLISPELSIYFFNNLARGGKIFSAYWPVTNFFPADVTSRLSYRGDFYSIFLPSHPHYSVQDHTFRSSPPLLPV